MTNEHVGNELRWKLFYTETSAGGSICLADWMGDDFAIAEAARTSYGEGTRRTSADRQLIRHLMRQWHTSPFEMAELKFRVRVPMDTWRQWIRHRTASVNEYSTRYSVAIDDCVKTLPGQWRLQSTGNRQGSSGLLTDGYPGVARHLTKQEAHFQGTARDIYNERIEHGIAREQARKDLPLCNFTEAIWKIDLHNLFHFLRLRMDSHAQLEIREYANVIGNEIVAKLFPLAWEAFVDYRLEALQLTRLDIGVIQRMMVGFRADKARSIIENFEQAQDPAWAGLKKCRERDECREKLEQLQIIPHAYQKV